MHISEFYNLLLLKKGKARIIAAAATSPVVSSQEIDEYVQLLSEHIQVKRSQEAVTAALALVMANPEASIARMRQKGILRASRYEFCSDVLKATVRVMLEAPVSGGLSDQRLTYLRSLASLYELAPDARRMHGRILQLLIPRKTKALKTIFVLLNKLFSRQLLGDLVDFNRAYSREEMAEAASMLTEILIRKLHVSTESIFAVDDTILQKDSDYIEIFRNALLLIKFKEAEIYIDGLPYLAEYKESVVDILSINPDLEKSIRLGYIQNEIQRLVRLEGFVQQRAAGELFSMHDLVERGFAKGLGEWIELRQHPFPRLVLKIHPHSDFISKMFSGNELFEEEWADAMVGSIDYFDRDFNEIFMITDAVSTLDILKVQRLFRFVNYIFQRRLNEVDDVKERELLNLRSIIPVFHYEELLGLIRAILPAQPEEIVKLLTQNTDGGHIDLQYMPFLKIGDLFLVSPSITAESNLIRNVTRSRNFLPRPNTMGDPMQKDVVKALNKANFRCEANVEIKIKGKKIEIDIVAWRNGHLFLFECKNAYLPCSVHEMRNSFDHIVKAGKQLDLRLKTFEEKGSQAYLFKSLGWAIPAAEKVYSAIIIANRVFNGYTQSVHPVRQAHELINVLIRGEIRLSDRTLSFWRSPEFEVEDLVDYLTNKAIICDQMSNLQRHETSFAFGRKFLRFTGYSIDVEALAKILISKYRTKQCLESTLAAQSKLGET